MDIKTQKYNIFPVPMYSFNWKQHEQFNARLRALILRKKTEDPEGLNVSNIGGWHSKNIEDNWESDDLGILDNMILSMIGSVVKNTVREWSREHVFDWKIQKWANVNKTGDGNARHSHIDLFPKEGDDVPIFSGVYYVNGSGPIRFHNNTIPYSNTDGDQSTFIKPTLGQMILFPADLEHSVPANSQPEHRISIAFNLSNPGFKLPIFESALHKQMQLHMELDSEKKVDDNKSVKTNARKKVSKRSPATGKRKAARRTNKSGSSQKTDGKE